MVRFMIWTDGGQFIVDNQTRKLVGAQKPEHQIELKYCQTQTPKMVSQWSAAAVTVTVLVLMQAQLIQSRPKDSKQTVATRRQDDHLTRETEIGESKVYGLIHDESEGKEAIQEKEHLDSKVLSVFDNVQQKIVNLLDPGAIVDKATPKDNEPNPIEDYDAFRKGIITVVDFIAKQLNAIIGAPTNIIGKANKSFTKTLNDVGAKLIGLE